MNDALAQAAENAPAPLLFAPDTPSASTQKPRGPVRVSGGVMSGNLRSGVDPVYPVEARQKKLEGAVVIDTLIGKDGAVETLKVVSGPAIFAGAASDAVRQWVYKPFYLNGQPTEVRTTVTVNFRLASSSPPR